MADSKDNVVSNALVDAVRKVKIAAAERSDVVVDMKEADRARLEILAQRLQPVFDDVPANDERFDFVISSGLQPRLWIDATAHVMMGRDRRTYRFVRDTRMGRIILAEGSDAEPIAETVITYIAERLHERELAFAADELLDYRARKAHAEQSEATAVARPTFSTPEKPSVSRTQEPEQTRVMSKSDHASQTRASALGLWLLGLFIGGGALLLVFQDAIFGALQ
ncbi:MAG: hypothetical protein AAFO77_06085 [Pseudomonadota bacterium]